MSPFSEEQKTEQAVNEAAREDTHERHDDRPVRTSGTIMLLPSEPDITVTVHSHNGVYFYSIVDEFKRLGHTGCGKLPDAFDADSGTLYGLVNALRSVTNARAAERLCERYGYSNRRTAKASGRRLQVAIQTTDRDLCELGRTFSEAENPDVLLACLNERDRLRYNLLIFELKRFQCTWAVCRADDPNVCKLAAWGRNTLSEASHDGPVLSFTRSVAARRTVAEPAAPAA